MFNAAQFHALIQYPDARIATNAKAVSKQCNGSGLMIEVFPMYLYKLRTCI